MEDYWLDWPLRRKYFNEETLELKDPTKYHVGRIWEKGKIVVPYQRWEEVIARYHDAPAAGHWGVARTTALVKRLYTFRHLRRMVRWYVRTCDVCQKGKADTRLPRGHRQNLEVPMRKWESISMDFVALPLEGSQEGPEEVMPVDEILTVTDRASKMVVQRSG